MTYTSSPRCKRARRRPQTLATAAFLVCVCMLSACGSSSSSTTAANATASKPAYCATLTSLEQSVKALTAVRPTKNGTGALQSAFTQVANQATALAGQVKSEFSTQTEALKKSVATLSSTVKQIASSPTKANLSQIPGEVAAVSTAVKNLASAASPKCG